MKLGTTLMSLWMNFRQVMGATGPPPSTLLDDLVSYWPLNEVSGTRYDVVGTNHLTDNNTVGAVLRGPEGTVAKFITANSESLTKTSPAGMDWTGSWTLAFWCNYPDASAYYDTFNVTSNPTRIYRAVSTGAMTFSFNAGTVNPASQVITNGDWHLVTTWHDGAGGYGYSIDGITPVTASGTQCNAGTNLFLGVYTDGGSNALTGALSKTAFWSRVLDASERTALFASGNGLRYAELTDGLKTGLVSWWELDEVSGVRYDSHGTNHLTDNNTVGSVINAGAAMDGAAASFVAANSESLSNAAVAIDPSAWTFAHWVKMPSGGGNGIPVDIENLFYYWPSLDQVYVYGTPTTDIGSPPPADGSWHLMVVWQDGNTAGVQVDGGTPETAVLTPKAAANWNMRFVHPSFLLDCAVDEPAIWDRVLTADERAELYNAGAGYFYPFPT